jgi:hypothetical protein
MIFFGISLGIYYVFLYDSKKNTKRGGSVGMDLSILNNMDNSTFKKLLKVNSAKDIPKELTPDKINIRGLIFKPNKKLALTRLYELIMHNTRYYRYNELYDDSDILRLAHRIYKDFPDYKGFNNNLDIQYLFLNVFKWTHLTIYELTLPVIMDTIDKFGFDNNDRLYQYTLDLYNKFINADFPVYIDEYQLYFLDFTNEIPKNIISKVKNAKLDFYTVKKHDLIQDTKIKGNTKEYKVQKLKNKALYKVQKKL